MVGPCRASLPLTCAAAVSRAILAGVLSSAVAVTRTTISPSALSDPAGTSSPAATRDGRDSPEMCAIETPAAPQATTPSRGT